MLADITKTSTGGAFLSHDQDKYFDLVEYQYLFPVFVVAFSFPFQVAALVWSLYLDHTVVLTVNAYLSPPFLATFGVRMGCPLTPLIILLSFASIWRRMFSALLFVGFRFPVAG